VITTVTETRAIKVNHNGHLEQGATKAKIAMKVTETRAPTPRPIATVTQWAWIRKKYPHSFRGSTTVLRQSKKKKRRGERRNKIKIGNGQKNRSSRMNKNTPGNRRPSSLVFLPLSSLQKKKNRVLVLDRWWCIKTPLYLPTKVVGEYCGFVSIH